MGISIRPTGLDHAAAALKNLERRQDVIANNLANVSTPGFKGERVFSELLASGGTPVIHSATDRRAGTLTSTGSPLDLAITGDGFFVVNTPAGERLSRGGSIEVDSSHRIVDATGNPLLGEDDPKGGVRGPITIPETARTVQIDRGGAVIADGVQIARLRFESVAPDVRLEHDGRGLFRAPDSRQNVETEARTVRQGAYEESNVDTTESLVDLISVQRAYANVQKVMTTIDSARGLTVVELGKPA